MSCQFHSAVVGFGWVVIVVMVGEADMGGSARAALLMLHTVGFTHFIMAQLRRNSK